MNEFMRIGDICDILNGYAFKSSKYVADGIRVIRITNVQKGFVEDTNPQYYPVSEQREIEKYMLCEGDLLMSLTGNVGRVGLLSAEMLPAALNQRVACIRIRNPAVIYKPFLFHLLNSDYFENKCILASQGVAQKNMSTEWLKEYPIPSFSMDKQMEIASIFDKIDDLIARRKEQVRNMDQAVKSRFIELFGMPGTDAFGWGLVPLGSTCNINPKKSLDSRLVSGAMVSFVPMPAVTEHGEIDATAIKEYDEVKTGFTYFAENDVLFAKITPCMENGKGAVAKGLHNGIGFGSTEFHVLRPISGKTDPYWIYTLTAFSQFRIDAASNMTGSAGQRRVPASFLENYRVSLPPIELQEQFAAFVEQTDKSKLCGKMEVAA
jgi:type I restriction enzyme S subunit